MIGGSNVAVLCVIPVGSLGLLFCHELGHAIPVLLAGGRADITVGSHEGWTATVGRLSVTVGMDGLWSLFTYGYIEWSGVDSRSVLIASILGGPFVTVSAVVILGVALLRGADGPWFWVLGNLLVSESYRASQTILPKTYSQGPYEGLPSDGQRLRQLLRSEGDGDPA